jgi:hypothetical protein
VASSSSSSSSFFLFLLFLWLSLLAVFSPAHSLAKAYVDLGGKFDAGCATTGSPGDLTYAPNLWCVIVSMARRATWVLARRIMTDCTTTVAIVAAGKACTYFHAP